MIRSASTETMCSPTLDCMPNKPTAKRSNDPATETSFGVAMVASPARPRHVMKHGDCFLVVDSHGDIGAAPGESDGLFLRDTRYLSHLELRINGLSPLLLGSNLSNDNCVLTVDLANPDFIEKEHIVLRKNLLHVSRTLFVTGDALHQRLVVHNFGADTVSLLLSVTFASDFADLFEVRGLARAKRGSSFPEMREGRVKLNYEGLDRVIRRTEIRFEPTPTALTEASASFRLSLKPQASSAIYVTACCDCAEEERPPFLRIMRRTHREMKQLMRAETTIHTSNDRFNEMLRRSTVDLAMLLTETPQGLYPYAGIPWYSTTFGRDGLITALQSLWLDGRMALAVLRRLAALQATEFDDASDAQPGKILHEMRSGEMANVKEIPFGLYYGSVDSTPLFVLLAGRYAQTTGDIETVRELWPAIEHALGWINGPGDPDQDGFLEYHRQSDKGLVNQGWKDSQDAVFHADGRLAEGPIALCEVQSYVYLAKRLAAECARRLGFATRAEALDDEADYLKTRFEEAFWCEELNTYALALDGNKAPCRVRSSNAGQVLFSGIAHPERARRIAAHLMEPESFSGWGVRTVSTLERRYNPMSYHNGSVWPHDNSLIALGFSRYGAKSEVGRIFRAQFDAATYLELNRLPELFCGFPRFASRGPTLYPVACAPQAWAAGTFFALLQASLGIEQDPWRKEIRFRSPILPNFLDEVVLNGLGAGSGCVDVVVRRHRTRTSLEILRAEGNINVKTELED
jgi:glycogen debranching enzyme